MAEAVQTESIMNLVRARAEAFGELADSDLAKSKFSRDVIPSQASALPGVKKPQSSAQVGAVERNKLMNETRIVASVLAKMFPWMYQKPADAKGETKVLRKAEEQHNVAKENIKVAKSSKSRLGKIFGALAAGLLLWAAFKDKIIELWDKHSGSLLEKIKWLGGKVLEGLKWLWDQIWPYIRPLFEWLGEKIWNGVQWLGEVLGNVWTNVKIALGKGFFMVVRGVDFLLSFLKAAFNNLLMTLIKLPITIARHVAAFFVKVGMKTIGSLFKGLISLVGKIPGLGGASKKLNKKIDASIEKTGDLIAGRSFGEQLVDIKVKQEGPGDVEQFLIDRGLMEKLGADEKGREREYVKILPKTGVFEDKPDGITPQQAPEVVSKKLIETWASMKEIVRMIKGEPDYSVAAAAWRAEVARQEKEDREFRERSHFRTQPWPGSPKDDPWGYRRAKEDRARQGIRRYDPDRAMKWRELQAKNIARKMSFSTRARKMRVLDPDWGRDSVASVAKPFTGYRPTTILGGDTSKTDDILTSSETLLQKIEQNTRGGMGNTIVNAGQRGGGQQRGSSPNTISPNTATVGAPKKDSHYTYVDSDYIERPNTLVS